MEAFGEAVDVPDPTDWLGTPLAALGGVEQALRCHVCKEFYKSPMLTTCNHTFCSVCIRRSLTSDSKCPLCRKVNNVSDLRGNWALREAVDAFVSAREGILQYARTPATVVAPTSTKRGGGEMEEEDDSRYKRPRMSTRASTAQAAQTTAAMAQEQYGPPGACQPSYVPDDGLVPCPICCTRMKEWQVDRHIDTSCPGGPPPQPQPSSTPGPYGNGYYVQPAPPPETLKPPDRLPTLAYSMLKDTALRKKMVDLGIPAFGSRLMMERRHQEWVTLWNANCDSARPKNRQELLHDLDIWERTIGTRAPTASRAATVGQQIKDKDFNGAAWAAKHDDSFKDLIANARRTRSQAENRGGGEEAQPAQPPDWTFAHFYDPGAGRDSGP